MGSTDPEAVDRSKQMVHNICAGVSSDLISIETRIQALQVSPFMLHSFTMSQLFFLFSCQCFAFKVFDLNWDDFCLMMVVIS